MLHRKHLFYSLISGCMLGIPWNMPGSGVILCAAFVPLLLVADDYLLGNENHRTFQVFLYSSVAFFIWNAMATWWICNATITGGVTIILFNTVLSSFVFTLCFILLRFSNRGYGLILFVSYWVSFEYLYTNAEISWPMLSLGNGLSNCPVLIQWYAYTGTFGGTVWILFVNSLLFVLIKQYINNGKARLGILFVMLASVIIPISLSLYMFYSYKEIQEPVHVVVIQPNIDPFHEKYGSISPQKQMGIILQLADSLANKSTNYFLAPETAIDQELCEEDLDTAQAVIQLKSMVNRFPEAQFIIGASTMRSYGHGNSDKTENRTRLYFNSALQIDTSRKISIYHKSKLVVGIEKIPYPKMMHYISGLLPDLGGLSGNLGTQRERLVFASPGRKIKVAPIICYESCFGDFTSGFVRKGANLLFILTNDGWFGNTPGPWIHLNYARMRAIETRRCIARSANTGISASIDQRGEVTRFTGYDRRTAFETTLNANNKITFYTKHGDYVGKWACVAVSFILLLVIMTTLYTHLNKKTFRISPKGTAVH